MLRRLEQRSTTMKEQRQIVRGRVEWVGVRWLLREEESTTSLSDRRRDEMTHGAVAACVARGADVVAGQHRWREVAAAAE
jgi:hypothetical protein